MRDKIIGFLIGFFVCLFGVAYVTSGQQLDAALRFSALFLGFGAASFIGGLCLGAGVMATAKVIIERSKNG